VTVVGAVAFRGIEQSAPLCFNYMTMALGLHFASNEVIHVDPD
jgi:hypothetical protein